MALRGVLPAIVALLFVLTASLSWAQSEDLADVIERCERSVIRIEVEGKTGQSLGSGFVVGSNGVFVTNVHVLAGALNATATFANGKQVEVKGTYYWDESRDVCVGRIEGGGYDPIDVVEKLPRKGETVTALGAPRGLSFTATNGIVSALRAGKNISPKYTGKWVQIDAALSPGNSGGPLINRSGEVVAMSTLASRGDSQNLNFGISSEDILDAIDRSKQKDLVRLKDGIAELETDETGGAQSGGIIQRLPIPASALADYVADCRDDYKSLSKKFRSKSSSIRKKVSLMKKGGFPIPGGSDGNDIVLMHNPRTKVEKYFFRTERVKERVTGRYQQQLDLLVDAKSKIGKEATEESVYSLMKHTGGFLDTRNKGSIGFMDTGIVLHAFNDHDTVVLFDEQQYLMWLPSTSGLSSGSEVPPGQVYVSGTRTIELPGKGSMSVTVLLFVSDAELKKAIFGDSHGQGKSSAGTSIDGELVRVWTSGKHTLMAQVIRVSDDQVTLKKINGKTVKVDRSKLSDGDQKYLESLK